jgi:hypothetical protein
MGGIVRDYGAFFAFTPEAPFSAQIRLHGAKNGQFSRPPGLDFLSEQRPCVQARIGSQWRNMKWLRRRQRKRRKLR